MDLKNTVVTVIGAARSGIAAANLIMASGGTARISDQRSLSEIEGALANLNDRSRVMLEVGRHSQAFIETSDLVVVSPGVPRDAEPMQWARAKGIEVWAEIELAWRFCERPVIAVTGSNGKTTTVTLITEVLKACGRRARLCGNVGTPFAQYVLEQKDVDVFVLETSSFQLEQIVTFRPSIAVLLNISQNHLDRHADMEEYLHAKQRIFMNQTASDVAVLNAKDLLVRGLETGLRAQVRLFGEDNGALDPDRQAALEVARVLNLPEAKVRDVMDRFAGVEHRLEKVRSLEHVEFINDSKSTTVEAGRWALARASGKVVLIAGGHDKGSDFSAIREDVMAKVRALILLTAEEDCRQKFHKAFDGCVPIEECEDVASAVMAARYYAQPGDQVLLSPMCASFDLFDDYEQRGKVFKEVVNGL